MQGGKERKGNGLGVVVVEGRLEEKRDDGGIGILQFEDKLDKEKREEQRNKQWLLLVLLNECNSAGWYLFALATG
ncbi:unnamed protein product [Sphenostylis stenocarpa]|uniref:Uncharacterized protein n=1 Tax=Sphenostylis stenocarpa TaxID=92480 RepID=A0AA86SHS0_9FABA|nr:unnamed protein product [Sphenostylis stenocarpa]